MDILLLYLHRKDITGACMGTKYRDFFLNYQQRSM